MTQEIENHKLKWLRKQAFRVEVKAADAEKALAWLQENVEEKSYEYSIKEDLGGLHTFFFENASDASSFREELFGDSRTLNVS